MSYFPPCKHLWEIFFPEHIGHLPPPPLPFLEFYWLVLSLDLISRSFNISRERSKVSFPCASRGTTEERRQLEERTAWNLDSLKLGQPCSQLESFDKLALIEEKLPAGPQFVPWTHRKMRQSCSSVQIIRIATAIPRHFWNLGDLLNLCGNSQCHYHHRQHPP